MASSLVKPVYATGVLEHASEVQEIKCEKWFIEDIKLVMVSLNQYEKQMMDFWLEGIDGTVDGLYLFTYRVLQCELRILGEKHFSYSVLGTEFLWLNKGLQLCLVP